MEFCVAKIEDVKILDDIQKSCLEKLEHQDFEFLLESKNHVVVCGKIDGEIIAFVSASISFEQSDILQVCVLKEFRRKGIAKELFHFFENIMKERGVCELFLEVNEKNIPALALYDSCGFEFLSKRKKYYGENDAIVMKKHFRNF